MPYPPYLARQISYRQNENAGNPIPTAMLDAEFNDTDEVVNQINRRVRAITNVAGQLINVAAQIAMALVGTQRFAPSGATLVFLTTITWDSSFSNGNVLVNANGLQVDPNTVTVANNGGFLEVTLGTAVSSGWVDVAAFSQGAGILTRLNAQTNADGASLVGIEDVGNYYTAVEVEGALQEVAAELAALVASLGTIADIWTRNGLSIGGDAAAADFDLGTFRVKNIADAVSANDAVSLQQLQAITQNLDTLLSLFIRADGAVPFTGDQSLGGHRLTNLGAAIANGDAVRFEQFMAIDGSQIVSGTIPGVRLGPFGGATGVADGTQGAVPAPLIADFAADKFLSADGTFKAVPSNLGGYCLIQDQKANGTNGGSSLSLAWHTHDLNTEVVDTQNVATVAANQATLIAGTYRARLNATFYESQACRVRLRDVTNNVTLALGVGGYTNSSADYAENQAGAEGRFTLVAPTAVELQYWVRGAQATNGLGHPATSGEVEVYASLELIYEGP